MANAPHGGELKDLLVRDAGKHDALVEEARSLKDIFLTEVSGHDLWAFQLSWYRKFEKGSADISDNSVIWSSL